MDTTGFFADARPDTPGPPTGLYAREATHYASRPVCGIILSDPARSITRYAAAIRRARTRSAGHDTAVPGSERGLAAAEPADLPRRKMT